MAYSAGVAYLQVVPSFLGIERAIADQLNRIGRNLDRTVADALPRGMREGGRQAAQEGERAGNDYAGAFGNQIRRALQGSSRALPTIDLDLNPTDAQRAIEEVRQELVRIREQHINLEIDDLTALASIERVHQRLQELRRDADTVDLHANLSIATDQLDPVLRHVRTMEDELVSGADEAGDRWVGAFSASIRRRAEGAFTAIRASDGVSTGAAEQEILDIRAALVQLREEHTTLAIDDTQAIATLRALHARLQELQNTTTSVEISTNARAAAAEIDGAIAHARILEEEFEARGREAGERYGGAFGREIRQRLTAAFAALPDVEIDANSTLADVAVARIRTNLETLSGQTIGLDIDDDEFRRQIDEARADLEFLARNGTTVQIRANARAALATIETVEERLRDLDTNAGHFARDIRRQLAGALRALPEVEITANSTDSDRTIDGIRQSLLTLRDRTIGIDIDEGDFIEQVELARQQLEELAESGDNVIIRINARAALAQLRELEAQIEETERNAGRAARVARAGVEQALRDLPDMEINANSTPAQRVLANLRDELAALRDQTIGVDIDADEFTARVVAIEHQLRALEENSPDVQVRIDAAAARARLREVAEQVDRLNGQRANVNVNTSDASTAISHLGTLIALGASLGTIVVPAAAAAAAAIGGIAAGAGAAVAGVGVLALGLSGIGGGVKALNKYQEDAAKSAKSLGGAENQVASALDGVASAQEAVTNLRITSGIAARHAARQVEEAQRRVTDSQKEALRAQVELTEAIEAAREADEDRVRRLKAGSLAQRQATLDLAEAKRDLDNILGNSRATEEEREQALITFEQRTLQLDELGARQKKLQAEQDKSVRVGVMGSELVVNAQERVNKTTQAAIDAQVDLAEAISAQKEQQRSAAAQMVAAQRAVAAAQRGLEQAFRSSGTAGGEALSNLKTAMDNLSPAGQRFAKFIFSLKDEFLSLRAAAETGLLPGVEEGIRKVLPHLGGLRTFIASVSREMGSIFNDAVGQLENPIWGTFFDFIRREAVPALRGMFVFSSNIAQGITSIVVALSPFNGNIGSGLIELSEKFQVWALTLSHSQGYKDFLAYVKSNGPRVVDLLAQLGKLFLRIAQAAAPVGEVMLIIVKGLVALANAIPIQYLTGFIGVVAALSVAVLLITKTVALWNAVMLVYRGIATIATVVTQGLSLAMATYRGETATATVATQSFGFGVATAGVAARGSAVALGSMSAVLGPLGVALALVTVGFGFFLAAQAEAKARIDSAKSSMESYGELFKKGITPAAVESAQSILRQNKELRDLVNVMKAANIPQATLIRGLNGDAAARQQIIDAIQRQIDIETKIANSPGNKVNPEQGKAAAKRIEELEALRIAFAKTNTANAAANQLTNELANEQKAGDPVLNQFRADMIKLASSTSTAADKVEILRRNLEILLGPEADVADATRAHEAAIDDLTDSIELNGKTLDEHTKEGRANIDAVRDRIAASKEMFFADIAAGKSIAEATAAHDARTAAMQTELHKMGLVDSEVKKLIDIYGQVKPEIVTAIKLLGGEEAFRALGNLQSLVVSLIIAGDDPAVAIARAKRLEEANKKGVYGHYSEGGHVYGAGTTTSDSIRAWLSRDEFVQPAHAVAYYGDEVMEALRHKAIPREFFHQWRGAPGFAAGGSVNAADLRLDVQKYKIVPAMEDLAIVRAAKLFAQGLIGPSVPSSGGVGWQRMMDILHTRFPGLALMSGYRPGDTVGNGELSYHAFGRAVDLPPRMDVFNWIRGNYTKETKELIHTPGGDNQVWNGRPWRFTGDALVNSHYNHVHWAMDSGGLLQPGWNPPIWNGTSKPEPVLTGRQWSDINTMANNSRTGGARNYNFEFRDTTLDAGKLRALQAQESARARDGRAR